MVTQRVSIVVNEHACHCHCCTKAIAKGEAMVYVKATGYKGSRSNLCTECCKVTLDLAARTQDAFMHFESVPLTQLCTSCEMSIHFEDSCRTGTYRAVCPHCGTHQYLKLNTEVWSVKREVL